MLTYRLTDILDVVGFSYSNYAGYGDDKMSTFGFSHSPLLKIISSQNPHTYTY